MKRPARNNNSNNDVDEIVNRHLGLFNSPPPEQMEDAQQRILRRLRSETTAEELPVESSAVHWNWGWQRLALLAAAAAVVLVVFAKMPASRNAVPASNAMAVVETTDGGLVRVSGGQAVQTGEPIEAGHGVRTNGDVGAVLVLADGSRIEMRSQSELSLERADDGVRIRLSGGGVIVSAAKQRTGHLYVQTKDVTVSVVGTVFFVNAEEAGSRVAVIQGEVQVEQGATSKTLLPGEQVATSPWMESYPVREEISWSRDAEAHLALLDRPAALAGSPVSNGSTPHPPVFEVASIKLVPGGVRGLPPIRCRGVDGIVALSPVGSTNSASAASVPQGRCAGSDRLSAFIAIAYDIDPQRILGGPGWASASDGTERYLIEAENTSGPTAEQFRPMLQTLLLDRFKLKVHRETREIQGYALLAGKGALKIRETSADEDRPAAPPQLSPAMSVKGNFRLRRFADFLWRFDADTPVIDKTDLPGIYAFDLTLHPVGGGATLRGGRVTPVVFDPPLSRALEDQLGLRLEAGKVAAEYLVIDHVERPPAN